MDEAALSGTQPAEVSPSNAKAEISGKVDLYSAKGAQEGWMISEDRTAAQPFSAMSAILQESSSAPGAELL